jgi:DNA-binding MarR family transcriptional regulator
VSTQPAPVATRGERARGARYSEAGAASYQLLQELDRAAAIWGERNVSRSRLGVLRVLAVSGPLTISDVARARHVTRQGAQRLVRSLEQEGWLALRENPKHRRAPLVELTPAGLAAYQRLSEREAERLNDLARGLSAEAIRSATRVVQALRIRGAAARSK